MAGVAPTAVDLSPRVVFRLAQLAQGLAAEAVPWAFPLAHVPVACQTRHSRPTVAHLEDVILVGSDMPP